MSRSPSPAFGFALTAFFWAFGCRRDVPVEFVPQTGSVSVVQATVPELRFGVQPVVSARPLWERYDPLIEQLNAVTGATFRVRLESAQSFINYERKLRARALDVLIVDPHQVLEAERLDYRVFARSGNADRVAGVIVVRRDAGVNRVLDLQGKTICFGAAE